MELVHKCYSEEDAAYRFVESLSVREDFERVTVCVREKGQEDFVIFKLNKRIVEEFDIFQVDNKKGS